MNHDIAEVHTTVVGGIGLITLNRPKALNALSLPMVQALLVTLHAWRDDSAVFAVAIRGSNKIGRPGSPEALFGGFCAGGDIRFFHQAALAGDPALDDFFTQEYTLNHLIHNYPKPRFLTGCVLGTAALLSLPSLHAALLAGEGFNYASGTPVHGASGGTGSS